MRKTSILLAGSALAIIASPALAQSAAGGTDSAPAASRDEATTGADVVVMARKRVENVQDVPLAISVFGGATLEQRGVTSVVDVSRQSPGVFFAKGPSGATSAFLAIRGQTQPDNLLTTDSSVGVYFDGVYIPRQYGLLLSMYDVDRVEVLKGPQGTLYGKNTTGGAVNIFTTQPGDSLDGYAKLTGGTHLHARAEAGFTVPLAEGASIRVAGFVNTRDELQRNDTGHQLGNNDSAGARATLKLEPTSGVTITLAADTLTSRDGGARTILTNSVPVGAASNFLTTGSPFSLIQLETSLEAGISPVAAAALLDGIVAQRRDRSADAVKSEYDSTGFSGTASVDVPGIAGQIKSVTAYRTMKRLDVLDIDGTPFTFFSGSLPTDSKFFSEELQISDDGSHKGFRWIGGFYYNRETGHDGSTSVFLPRLIPFTSITDGDVKNTSYSFFGQTTVGLTDRLNVTAGVRYTSESKGLVSRNHDEIGGVPIDCSVPGGTPAHCEATFKDTFDGVSYLGSIDYKAANDVLLYAKTSRSFRGGGQNLRGAYDAASGRGTFQAFRPEIATDYEIGLKSQFLDRRVTFNLAGYYTKYQNVQRNVFVQLTPTSGLLSQVLNAASAEIYGGEAELSIRPTEGLTFGGTAGLVDAKYKTFNDPTVAGGSRVGEPFPVPKWTFSLNGGYSLPTSFGHVALDANYTWQSDVNFFGYAFDDFAVTQPSYGLLNANITFHLESIDADVAVYGTNVLNKNYIVSAVSVNNPGAALGYSYAYLGEPSEFGIRLTKRFGR